MGLRGLGSLSFRDNLTMAGVVQFHAKLLLGSPLFLLIFAFLIYFLLFCDDKNYGINLMEEDLKNSDDYKECIKTKKIYKG